MRITSNPNMWRPSPSRFINAQRTWRFWTSGRHTEEIGSRQTLHAGYGAGRAGSNLNGQTKSRMVEGPIW
jgi:hypothetical protein